MEARGHRDLVNMSNLRILLVEDERVVADVYERMLDRLIAAFPGATVTRIESLRELRDILRGLAPDVAILDLTLRDASREVTIEEISRVAERCPVIVVTGSSDPTLREVVMKRGASGFIFKPELHASRGLLERVVTAAITTFKVHKREGLTKEIEALRRFAIEHDNEA